MVRHIARSVAIDNLQNQLVILERGKQSGVIGISLEGSSAERTAAILNAIGTEYVDQNVRRKAAEAEKSLEFLETSCRCSSSRWRTPKAATTPCATSAARST